MTPTNHFESLLIISAFLGGGLFALQLLFQFTGTDSSDSADLDVTDGDGGSAFKVLSLQGLSAFFLMFGLTGLMCQRAFGWSTAPSLAGAATAGLLTLATLRAIYRAFHRLQSDGTLRIERALGAEGSVYLSITPDKPGKVTIVVDGRQITRDAIVETGETLVTGTAIVVSRIHDDGTLAVAPLDVRVFPAETDLSN